MRYLIHQLRDQCAAALGDPQLYPSQFGDLCSELAFKLCKQQEAADPQQIAQQLAANLKPSGYLGRVEPLRGYLNFFGNSDYANQALAQILELGNEYGKLGDFQERILIEHTSANPDGPLHIGHLRNAALGDSLARMFRAAGYPIEIQYYVNDMGRQIAQAFLGYLEYGLDPALKPDHALAQAYIKIHSKIQSDPSLESKVDQILREYELGQLPQLRALVDRCLEGIFQTLSKLGVSFDSVIYESQLVWDGMLQDALQRLSQAAQLKLQDGALMAELPGLGDVVLKRSDGTSLYIARDLCYHIWKHSRSRRSINVLGADHKLFSQQLAKLLELIGIPPPQLVIFEFVSLEGQRMSTRAGRYISVDELIQLLTRRVMAELESRKMALDQGSLQQLAEQVALGALRFEFAKISPSKPLDFRLDSALDLKSKTSIYLQYSYARASSILNRAGEFQPEFQLQDPLELSLARKLSLLPLILEDALQKLAPYLMAEYAISLADLFNQFYTQIPVLRSPSPQRESRLGLVRGFKLVLGKLLEMLGVPALERI